MITVKVHTILDVKQILGKREVQIALPQGSTVADLLEQMVSTWGEKLSSLLFGVDSHELSSLIQIMVNGQAIPFLNGIRTELADGDDVLILPPVAGG